jgi:signal transduction histidine kinase
MRSYLEVPLRIQGGAVIGSYCVVHTEPRDFSELDIETLAEIGGCIVDHLELLRIKQEHDRAQHLISRLGTIVAGSLNSLSSINSPLQSMQNSLARPPLNAHPSGTIGSATTDSTTSGNSAVDDDEKNREELLSPDTNNIHDNLERLQLDDAAVADPPQRPAASTLSSSAGAHLSSDARPPSAHVRKPRGDHRDGDDDESMFADITRSIYQTTDVNGVLILDAQVADSLNESLYSRSLSKRHSSLGALDRTRHRDHWPEISFCKEVGTHLGPGKDSAATRPPKQLASSVLHWLLNRYPSGTILRREKDACLLDQQFHGRERDDRTIVPVAAALDAKESLFDYLDGPLQIMLAPMWAASHRNGPLCTVSWTRDRMRSFEDDDVALLSAFCNSAVANLARNDAVHTMQTKSKFMESISHELRSPIHGILASAELLESRWTDAESKSLLSNIQVSGATLLDTLNQLLVFTEMSSKERISLEDGGMTTTIDGDMTNGMSHVNLGTFVEEVVDAISLGHTVKSAHGKDLEMKRKGIPSNRALHNALAPITTAVTIHPEAAETVRAPVGVLRRLLMILFSNALNYTSHGFIEVELSLAAKSGEPVGRAIQLTVRDSGRGISQRYQDSRMFLPFSQENANSSGVGLGLSIAHRFVRQFGGDIDVESKQGIGTTMQVTLPFNNLFALEKGSDLTDAYLPTLLRDYVKGRSVCLVASGESFNGSESHSKPSVDDSTQDVLSRSLEVTLSECFCVHIVKDTESPEAFMEISDGEVFISRASNLKAREFKVQNPYVQDSTSY